MFLLLLVPLFLFGCGGEKKVETKNNVVESLKPKDYMEVTVEDVMALSKKTLQGLKNIDDSKEFDIKLVDAYMNIDGNKISELPKGKEGVCQIQFTDRGRSFFLDVLVDKEIANQLSSYKKGQHVEIWGMLKVVKIVDGFAVRAKKIEKMDNENNKGVGELSFNKDKLNNKYGIIYKTFVEVPMGKNCAEVKAVLNFRKQYIHVVNDRADLSGVKCEDEELPIHFTFEGKSIEGNEENQLSKLDKIDSKKVEKNRQEIEEKQEKAIKLIGKSIERVTLLKMIDKPIYVKDFQEKVEKINKSKTNLSYEEIVNILGEEGYLVKHEEDNDSGWMETIWYGMTDEKITIVMIGEFRRFQDGDAGYSWIVEKNTNSEDKFIEYYILNGSGKNYHYLVYSAGGHAGKLYYAQY